MTTNEILARVNLRKAALIVFGLGLLGVAAATQASAEVNCPQWSTPVCRHWNLGPPASCTEWGCAADKASDPVKKLALAPPSPVRPPFPRPPVVTPGPVKVGTGTATPVIYAKAFAVMGGHGRR
jgi:hypothetical protein